MSAAGMLERQLLGACGSGGCENTLDSSCKSVPSFRLQMIQGGKKKCLVISFHKLGLLFGESHMKAGYCADAWTTVVKFLLLPTHALMLLF